MCAIAACRGFRSVAHVANRFFAGCSLFAVPFFVMVIFKQIQFNRTARPGMASPGMEWMDLFIGAPWYLVFGLCCAGFAWIMPRIAKWSFDRYATKAKFTVEMLLKARKRRCTWRARSRKYRWSVFAASLALLAAAICFSPMAGLLAMELVWGALIFGVMYVGIGFTGRRGSRLVCERCDHGMVSWRSSPDVCTECGNAWKAPWGMRVGARKVWWKLVWIGIGMIAAGLGATVLFLVVLERR